jgi:YVTN family beta-propeller protein
MLPFVVPLLIAAPLALSLFLFALLIASIPALFPAMPQRASPEPAHREAAAPPRATLDARTLAVLAPPGPSGRPCGLAVTPDGAKLYSANGLADSVAVIDPAAARVTRSIAAGEGPSGIAIGPP